jgi:hypothetical protein
MINNLNPEVHTPPKASSCIHLLSYVMTHFLKNQLLELETASQLEKIS